MPVDWALLGTFAATLPADPDIAARARVNAANDLGRIRKEIAWSKRRPPAPKEMQSDWKPCSPSVPVADDLSIPDFLKREPAAVSESAAVEAITAASTQFDGRFTNGNNA